MPSKVGWETCSRDVTLLVDGPCAFSTPVARCTGLAEAVSSVGIGDAQELTWRRRRVNNGPGGCPRGAGGGEDGGDIERDGLAENRKAGYRVSCPRVARTLPMRPADIARLSQPYPDGDDRSTTEAARALDVQTPNWEALERRIFNDFTTDQPYGIGWWAPHPGTSRRILISDQLYACTTSVSTNLIEAGVHWLELLDAVDREDTFQADVIQIVDGQPQICARPRMTPLESLGPDMVRLHEVGIARALSGALDCVAGTIIGVMALPLSILKADFIRVQRYFGGRRKAPTTEGETQREQFAIQLTETHRTCWTRWLARLGSQFP